MLLTLPVTTAHASSLDDVVNSTTQESNEATVGQNNEPSSNTSTSSSQSSSSYTSADEYIENTKNAADLTTVDTAGADKVNDGIRTVAAFIVRILSYFLTAFLVVRVILDLVYIALPFTRSILSNGYAGNPAAGGSGMGMQQPGMGGMGMGAGMGGMTETCGAISGAVAIMGFVMSDGMENPKTKGQTYKLSREIAKRFGEKNTTTVCGTLKGIGSDKGPLRSCPGCIDDAVEIACDVLKQLAE